MMFIYHQINREEPHSRAAREGRTWISNFALWHRNNTLNFVVNQVEAR